MAKIYGLFGAMTGKVADAVMCVRNGEQIVRKYQPIVTNPNTAGQIEARAKLKLMSQLSAVMAPYIAIRKEGAVSTRNLFVKANYPLATYSSNEAEIPLRSVTLTRGILSMPVPTVSRTETNISVYLSGVYEGRDLGYNRVVYVAFERIEGNKLRYLDSKVVSTPGTQGGYNAVLAPSNNNVVVYVYGVRDNTEAARVVFGNISVPSASMVADLIVSRTLRESDVTLSETNANTLAAVEAQTAINDENRTTKKSKGE